MGGNQGTIEESGSGVTSMTYSREMYFHRVTKEEVDNLMNTSFEFQVFTGLGSLAFGALVSGGFSDLNTLREQVIFFASIPLTIIFTLTSVHFYKRMSREKERYFEKYKKDTSEETEFPTEEELVDMINDLLAQVASLQKQLGDNK